MIGYLIGVLIVFVPYIILKAQQAKYNGNRCYYHAKWLSKDKEPEYFEGGYIVYANGTRWFLRSFVSWELYWIPVSQGDDISKLIEQGSPEFKCTWLTANKMYKICRRIINTHPNLKAKGYWKIVKLLS